MSESLSPILVEEFILLRMCDALNGCILDERAKWFSDDLLILSFNTNVT